MCFGVPFWRSCGSGVMPPAQSVVPEIGKPPVRCSIYLCFPLQTSTLVVWTFFVVSEVNRCRSLRP